MDEESELTESFRVIQAESKDSFPQKLYEHVEAKQSSSQHHSQPLNWKDNNVTTTHEPRSWRRSFSGVLPPREHVPLPPWNRHLPEKYTLFQTRSPRISFHSRLSFNSRRNKVDDSGELPLKVDPVVALPPELENVPVGRYFDALQGPELEVLKESENVLLPLDQTWPFLLRFPISSFGIVMGLGSQTILWKKLATVPCMSFLHIPLMINLVLWCFALSAYMVIFTTYALKCIFYFEAVRREYYHPVRINFFFTPWLSGMFLTLGVPAVISPTIHPATWCCFMAPLAVLKLKIYGQWFSGGQRTLSKVANPTTHVSVVGNFVGAVLAATVGWKDIATLLFGVGLAHYIVVFVTLYQRLPTNEVLSRDMHPVYFLFIAIPSTASIAWEIITGEYGYPSKIAFAMAMFLLLALLVRINIFRGFKFSIAWWAYTFPLTAASIATIHYSNAITNIFTQGLAATLSFLSAIVVFLLFISTVVHAFVWNTLFPNDLAIAITQKKAKSKSKFVKKKDSSDSSGSSYVKELKTKDENGC